MTIATNDKDDIDNIGYPQTIKLFSFVHNNNSPWNHLYD